jgi:hypothetical protein
MKELLIGGGLIALTVTLIYEQINEYCRKKKIGRDIRNLFKKESDMNLKYMGVLLKRCEDKIKHPPNPFNSINIRFNVINYILDNLIELNISSKQFEEIMELKTSLENVIFWQDEYVNGTKGDINLMKDLNIIDFYIPIIINSIQETQYILKNNIF